MKKEIEETKPKKKKPNKTGIWIIDLFIEFFCWIFFEVLFAIIFGGI